MRKIQIFLHLLGIVVRTVGSVRDTIEVYLFNRFLSILQLDPVPRHPFQPWKTGIAVHRHVGTDSPKI